MIDAVKASCTKEIILERAFGALFLDGLWIRLIVEEATGAVNRHLEAGCHLEEAAFIMKA